MVLALPRRAAGVVAVTMLYGIKKKSLESGGGGDDDDGRELSRRIGSTPMVEREPVEADGVPRAGQGGVRQPRRHETASRWR